MVQRVGDKFSSKDKDNFSYRHVVYDNDGWASTDKYLPDNYDLVHLKLSTGNVIRGWRSNTNWDGMKFEEGHRVVAWKRTID